MANASTHIMDLPDAGQMDPTSYRQMNPHPNPYMQGQPRMDSMPLPEYSGGRNSMPPPIPPSYDFEQGPLGNPPKFSLPPKDIPHDMSGFQDNTATPNYVPPAPNNREDYVAEQETAITKTKLSEQTRKSVNRKFDMIATMQMPIIMAVLFFLFQINAINRIMSRYLNTEFFRMFGEDGNINLNGMIFKSVLFGISYFAITNTANLLE
jgi:hypothetical protein